jgi:hypothetical protein
MPVADFHVLNEKFQTLTLSSATQAVGVSCRHNIYANKDNIGRLNRFLQRFLQLFATCIKVKTTWH